MKSVFSAILFFLMSVSVIAATQETSATEAPAIEPLSTGYLVLLGVVSLVVLIGFWRYYMRWDEEEDKSDPKNSQ